MTSARRGAKARGCAPKRSGTLVSCPCFLFLFIVHASAPLSRACGVRNPSLFVHCLSRGAHGGRERLQLGHVPLLVSLFSLALEFARWTDRTHAPRSPMHTTAHAELARRASTSRPPPSPLLLLSSSALRRACGRLWRPTRWRRRCPQRMRRVCGRGGD